MTDSIPTTAGRTTLASSVKSFLDANPSLRLGGHEDFHTERRHHLEVFGFHKLPENLQTPIGDVRFHGIRGRHGTIPLRLFYPTELEVGKGNPSPALIYFHGGGYTVGSVDEFENGLRILAENSGIIVSLRTRDPEQV
jgi:acetyl esterase/lipase